MTSQIPTSSQFVVGFGPLGTHQQIVLAPLQVSAIPCDALISFNATAQSVYMDDTGLGRAKNVIHIPNSSAADAMALSKSIGQTLELAREHRYNRVAFDLPQDGLSSDQSARAILGAIYAYWDSEGDESVGPHEILISIHVDGETRSVFERELQRTFFPHREIAAGRDKFGVVLARRLSRDGRKLTEQFRLLRERRGDVDLSEILRISVEKPDLFTVDHVRLLSHYRLTEKEAILINLRRNGGSAGEVARKILAGDEGRQVEADRRRNRQIVVDAMEGEREAARRVVEREQETLRREEQVGVWRGVAATRAVFDRNLVIDEAQVKIEDIVSIDWYGARDVWDFQNVFGRLGRIRLLDPDREGERANWYEDELSHLDHSGSQYIELFEYDNDLVYPVFGVRIRVADEDEADLVVDQIAERFIASDPEENRGCWGGNYRSHRSHSRSGWHFFKNMHAYFDSPASEFGYHSDPADHLLPSDIGKASVTFLFHLSRHETRQEAHDFLGLLLEDFDLTFVSVRE